jgi:hypothetical protein
MDAGSILIVPFATKEVEAIDRIRRSAFPKRIVIDRRVAKS